MRRRPLLLPLVIVPLLVACGGDGDGGAAPGASPTAAASGSVTVEHAFGSTSLQAVPERIVSIGSQWNGALQALDVVPVAFAADAFLGGDGTFPWEGDLAAASEPIEISGDQLPLEVIAGYEPDLILVTFLASDQATFDSLAAIAPTIGALGERQVDTWQDQTEVLGQVLRREADAEAAIAEVEEQIDALAAELPGLVGQTFALANYVPGDAMYVVTDEEDGANLLFQALGMAVDPELVAAGDGVSGRAELSLEQIDLLDSDVVFLFTNDADPSGIPGYDALPAVQAGTVQTFNYADVVGLNTPSAPSIEYVLDLIRPTLEAAAS